MTRAPLRSLSAALLLALTGALTAACAGEEAPAASAPETSQPASAAVEASPSPGASDAASDAAVAKPARPAAMEKKDAEGAAAAAEYFLSLYTYVKTTGDSTDWDRMSHAACDFCKKVHDRSVTIQKLRLNLDGGELTAKVLRSYLRDEVTGIFPLDVRVTQEAVTATFPDGRVESESEKQSAEMRVEVGIRNGDWVVVNVVPKPED